MTTNRRVDSRVQRFEELYRATRAEILAYLLRRTPGRDDAADVLGDVYLTAWRRIDDVPAGDAARLWLYGTARRTLANHRRRNENATGIADTLRDELRVKGLADGLDLTDATTAAVHEALGALDADDRELLTLTAWERLTPADIATVTDEAPGTIRVRLHRARGELRSALERLGVCGDELADVTASPGRSHGPTARRAPSRSARSSRE